MSAYRRRWKKRRYHSPAEIKKYWDKKALQNPDVIPGNFDYNVPEVIAPQPIPSPTEASVGLTVEMITVARYLRDRFNPKPWFFELGYSLFNPFKAAEARSDFAKLSDVNHRSRLFMGKTLREVEAAMHQLSLKIRAHKADVVAQTELYRSQCAAREAEILRRHRQRIERLSKSSKEEASNFEEENFPTLALSPDFWSIGDSNKKGAEFEKKFSRLMRDYGYVIHATPISGDDGIDIIAERPGERVVIQCKNHVNKIGAPEVRDFIGALSIQQKKHPETKGWIVSVSGFTQPTLDNYDQLGIVELWDFSDIHEFVKRCYHQKRIGKPTDSCGELEP